jgi:hypothetical protein
MVTDEEIERDSKRAIESFKLMQEAMRKQKEEEERKKRSEGSKPK